MGSCHSDISSSASFVTNPRDIQKLCNAVRNENMDAIESCLQMNVSICAVNPNTDQTALEIASHSDNPQMFDRLVFSQNVDIHKLKQCEEYIKYLWDNKKIDDKNAKHMLTSLSLATAIYSEWM